MVPTVILHVKVSESFVAPKVTSCAADIVNVDVCVLDSPDKVPSAKVYPDAPLVAGSHLTPVIVLSISLKTHDITCCSTAYTVTVVADIVAAEVKTIHVRH